MQNSPKLGARRLELGPLRNSRPPGICIKFTVLNTKIIIFSTNALFSYKIHQFSFKSLPVAKSRRASMRLNVRSIRGRFHLQSSFRERSINRRHVYTKQTASERDLSIAGMYIQSRQHHFRGTYLPARRRSSFIRGKVHNSLNSY